MSDRDASTPGASAPAWWFRLLRWALRPLLKIKRITPQPETPPFDPSRPVLYLLEHQALSNVLILDQVCEEAGWPRPSAVLPLKYLRKRRRASLGLKKHVGWFSSAKPQERVQRLRELLTAIHLEQREDIQLVPVSIFVGRAPDRSSGWFKVLFSENWVVVGRLRRFLALLFNGRNTIVQFSPAVDVQQALAEPLDLGRQARKLARVLRVHFRRLRSAVIGPDLSHRRLLVDSVLRAPAVRAAIAQTASKDKISFEEATQRARRYALEIAADYSHPVVRSLSFILTWFWNQIYRGVRVHHFESLMRIAPGREVVYVPCHRSHIDYLLLSYLLYQNGLVPPHIAAGVNLNLPVIGSILRRGGAFFMRRSFKSNVLYTAVFGEYVQELIAQGFSLEYFIEGGRSRTGRLLAPRAGMLAMTVRSYLRAPQRPVVFQPVYIGYEKLIEGKSYIGELSGQAKEKESLLGLVRSLGVLREQYGTVTVNFGEPIELNEVLHRLAPQWREATISEDKRPDWLPGVIDHLAERIQVAINRAADVNPIALLGLILLGTPKHAIAEDDLLRLVKLYRHYVQAVPYSDRVTLTELGPAEVIAYGESMRWISRIKHPLGDVLAVQGDPAVLISYFRNNVLHLFVASSWVACCFLNNRRLSPGAVVNLGKAVYPFLKTELFLPWTTEDFGRRIEATMAWFVSQDLLSEDASGGYYIRPSEGSDAFFSLRVLAHGLLQTFQRYYLVVALLTKNGPRTLSATRLEELCHLTAQRIALLHELAGPEYFDKGLFKNFVQMLRAQRIVWTDEQGRLDYGAELERIGADSKLILSRELRHSIIKLTNESPSPPPPEQPSSSEAA